MTKTAETTGVYIVISILFFVLFAGIFGRAMGWTDPSAPSKPCCIKRSYDVDDLESQRVRRVGIERELKRKRELDEFKQRHMQALLVKKESSSRLSSLPKAATVDSLNGNVLKKAALPAGSSKGFRPPSRRFFESLQKFSEHVSYAPVDGTQNRISSAINRGVSSYGNPPKVDSSPFNQTHNRISASINRGASSYGDPLKVDSSPVNQSLNRISESINRGASSYGAPLKLGQQPLKLRGYTRHSSKLAGTSLLSSLVKASASEPAVTNPMGTSF
jgi:hypothetical protein